MLKRACACGERSTTACSVAVRRDIGHVTAGAAQQRVVLLAGERLTEAEFHRRHFFDDFAGLRLRLPRLARIAIQRVTT